MLKSDISSFQRKLGSWFNEKKSRNTRMIFVDGNIGSGKTTFIKMFKLMISQYASKIKKKVNIFTIKENIEKNIKLFEEYCKGNNAFEFQKWVIDQKIRTLSRVADRLSENKLNIIIFDRSILVDHKIFCYYRYKKSQISENDWHRYQSFIFKIISHVDQNFYSKPDIIIYINTSVQKCSERILKRDRGGENNYDKNYLEWIEKRHKEIFFFGKVENKLNDADLKRKKWICENSYTVDGNKDAKEIYDNLKIKI